MASGHLPGDHLSKIMLRPTQWTHSKSYYAKSIIRLYIYGQPPFQYRFQRMPFLHVLLTPYSRKISNAPLYIEALSPFNLLPGVCFRINSTFKVRINTLVIRSRYKKSQLLKNLQEVISFLSRQSTAARFHLKISVDICCLEKKGG